MSFLISKKRNDHYDYYVPNDETLIIAVATQRDWFEQYFLSQYNLNQLK